MQAGGAPEQHLGKVGLLWYHVLSSFEFKCVNNLCTLYNSARYHVCSSFAPLRKIFSFLPNCLEEGIVIAVLGGKHTRVRNKFSKHIGVRNNSFIMLTCCVAYNT